MQKFAVVEYDGSRVELNRSRLAHKKTGLKDRVLYPLLKGYQYITCVPYCFYLDFLSFVSSINLLEDC